MHIRTTISARMPQITCFHIYIHARVSKYEETRLQKNILFRMYVSQSTNYIA